MIIGVDWGSYLDYKANVMLPWADLVQRCGVQFAVFKGAQEQISANGNYSTVKNMQAARAAGVPIVGCYYWHDPTASPSYLVEIYSQAIAREQPDFIAVDIEQWEDGFGGRVASAKISETARVLCEGLRDRHPGKRVIVYSRRNFPQGYAPQMDVWLPAFDGGWVASWPDYGMQVYHAPSWEYIRGGQAKHLMAAGASEDIQIADWQPSNMAAWKTWRIWQYSSRMMLPVDASYGGQLDWNVFDGSLNEMLNWAGMKGSETMTGIYKSSVPMAQRGRFAWLSADDKNIDISGACMGVDALMLGMCSQASGNMTVLKDAAFQTWAGRATVPVLGVISMDQNLFWNKEITLPVFQARTMWTNETLRAIIDQWRSEQIPQAEWDAHKLNITAGSGWHKLGGLVLFMSTTMAKGSQINGMWQQAIVDDLLKPLTTLMQGGYIPSVPIYLMASSAWYKVYDGDSSWVPGARIASKQLAGLGLTRVYGQDEPGLITDAAPMAKPMTAMSELWQYVPADTYTYPIKLTGGIDFQFFVFSFNRLRVSSMFYPVAAITPVTVGVWCDTAANMGLGTVTTTPPIVVPPSDLVARVEALESKMAAVLAGFAGMPR